MSKRSLILQAIFPLLMIVICMIATVLSSIQNINLLSQTGTVPLSREAIPFLFLIPMIHFLALFLAQSEERKKLLTKSL